MSKITFNPSVMTAALYKKKLTIANPQLHNCSLLSQDDLLPETCWAKLTKKYQDLISVSHKNRYSLLFFRSQKAVREEKQRQYLGPYSTVIHPISLFRAWYDIYVFFLYTIAVVNKPIEGAFVGHRMYNRNPWYRYGSFLIDILCYIDIVVTFSCGYINSEPRMIELNPGKIAKHYIFGPFFIFDLLSSVPKSILCYSHGFIKNRTACVIVDMCCMLKIFRTASIIAISNKILLYFGCRLSAFISIIRATIISWIIIHFSACILYLVPKLMRQKRFKGNFWENYIRYFFKSSAFMLSVRLNQKEIEPKLPEEYILAIIFYIVGKMVVATIWVVLISFLLNARSATIEYRGQMNQLAEFLKQRQIPPLLASRVEQYYNFKFKNVHFKEHNINKLLSKRLKQEVRLVVYQDLVTTIPLLSLLTMEEFKNIQSHLEHEIVTPNTVVFYVGTEANYLHFLSSGTVAVYSYSGRELYHLKDGAYFGEISLIMKCKRAVTVMTIEFCEMIKLNRRCFEQYLMKNKSIAKHLNYWAAIKIQDLTIVGKDFETN